MKLYFHGGTGTVTGANYLLESGGERILIDCGLHQGGHFAEKQNFDKFPYDPKTVKAVFITHAHLDHTGRLPKLYAEGFRGQIFSTPPTRDLGELILLDSEHILSKEAEREKRESFFTVENVKAVMELWRAVPYHEPFTVGPFKIEFYDAGHILGSAIIVVEAEGKRIVFSGDLGNFPAPIIKPTELIEEADYCVIESTYGDRVHDDMSKRQEFLEDAIEDVVKRKGVLMIPAFAMERTQDLLYHLNGLVEKGRVPKVPIFIDSPLAIKMTAVYRKYKNYFNAETAAMLKSGDDILNFPGLQLTLTTEESKKINDVPPPKIVIAGSGMSQGGRILHHERRYLSDPKSAIIFIGYQSKGSLGRMVLEGAPEVKIFGERVPVRCEARALSAYSAHADQPKLLAWLSPMRRTLKKLFVVQGEPEVSAALAQKARDELAIPAEVPGGGSEAVL